MANHLFAVLPTEMCPDIFGTVQQEQQQPTEINEPNVFWNVLSIDLKKKKKKQCCEKYKRKGKRCGSCPLKGCA